MPRAGASTSLAVFSVVIVARAADDVPAKRPTAPPPAIPTAPAPAYRSPARHERPSHLDYEKVALLTGLSAPYHREIDGVPASLDDIAMQARIVPAFKGGVAVGFKLFSIRPDSIYGKAGLQNGDIVTSINGYDLQWRPGR
jgi:general secretion pathway protein C